MARVSDTGERKRPLSFLLAGPRWQRPFLADEIRGPIPHYRAALASFCGLNYAAGVSGSGSLPFIAFTALEMSPGTRTTSPPQSANTLNTDNSWLFLPPLPLPLPPRADLAVNLANKRNFEVIAVCCALYPSFRRLIPTLLIPFPLLFPNCDVRTFSWASFQDAEV